MMPILPSDKKLILYGMAAVLFLLGSLYYGLRRDAEDRALNVTPQEWRICLRILAGIFLALLLIYSRIALTIPGELFIYGRF